MPGFLSQGKEVILESRRIIIKYVQRILCTEVFCAFLFLKKFIRSLL